MTSAGTPHAISGVMYSDTMKNLDAFTLAYIECALWSSAEEDGTPLDATYGLGDITEECLAEMIRECADFQKHNAGDLEGLDDGQSGHDFWLTRNGHGAGFWDRGLGELGERLSRAAEVYGGVDLVVSEGKIYS